MNGSVSSFVVLTGLAQLADNPRLPLVSNRASQNPQKPNKTALFKSKNRFVSLKKPLLQVVYFEQYIKTDQLINHPPSIVRVSSSISPQRGGPCSFPRLYK
jgi:hypothetical protein